MVKKIFGRVRGHGTHERAIDYQLLESNVRFDVMLLLKGDTNTTCITGTHNIQSDTPGETNYVTILMANQGAISLLHTKPAHQGVANL